MLWIHAAAKKPENELIQTIEREYEGALTSYFSHSSGTDLPLPKHYPTSVLLGYVEIVDCLSHEQLLEHKIKLQNHKAVTPAEKVIKENPVDEENESDFVFVCQNPHRLVIPMAVSGQHKICECNT